MAVSADYLGFVLEQLAELGGVSPRRMFGAAGLYCDEYFFALISDDTLYLRVDDSNRADYTARGMAQFRPYADRPHLSMNYFETPTEVLEDARQLVLWASRSVAVARRAAASGTAAAGTAAARPAAARPARRPSRRRP